MPVRRSASRFGLATLRIWNDHVLVLITQPYQGLELGSARSAVYRHSLFRERYDSSVAVIVPVDQTILPAVWAFCSRITDLQFA